jgi:hypothetical protein
VGGKREGDLLDVPRHLLGLNVNSPLWLGDEATWSHDYWLSACGGWDLHLGLGRLDFFLHWRGGLLRVMDESSLFSLVFARVSKLVFARVSKLVFARVSTLAMAVALVLALCAPAAATARAARAAPG